MLKEVISEISPSKEEKKQLKKKIDDFLKKINNSLKGCKAILGGSGAKDTWLRGVKDADLFVLFPYTKYKNRSSELSDILEKMIKSKFKLSRLHGSRDYFQVKDEKFIFEIIPVLKITKAEQSLNITDISPLHAKYVNKHKKITDEIRLMKQFCKANDLYGAESHISGFSGYSCEVLVIHYGSFMKLIRDAAKWKPGKVIDTMKFYKLGNIQIEMNSSKLLSPLILVDPVQKSRNVTAALSNEKFNLFIKKAKQFIKKPSKKFFEEKEFDPKKLKGVVLEAEALKGKDDVVGGKIVKVYDFLNYRLKKIGFKVKNSGWHWNKRCFFWIEAEDLDKQETKKGPPLKIEDHAKAFKKKYKNSFVKNKQLFAKVKRKHRKAKDYIKEMIKEKYVKERVKSIKCL